MKLLNVITEIDQRTYDPILKVTLEISIESCIELTQFLKKDIAEEILGARIYEILKTEIMEKYHNDQN